MFHRLALEKISKLRINNSKKTFEQLFKSGFIEFFTENNCRDLRYKFS
jgi:hypothetical protein